MTILDKAVNQIKEDQRLGLPLLQIATPKSERVRLYPNYPQKLFLRDYEKHNNLIVLKSRQMGFSTIIQGLYFLAASHLENINSVIVSHEKESTKRMLARSDNFYKWLPEFYPNPNVIPKLTKGNANELYFENLNSRIFIGTAGSDAFGRGDTITHLHLSEMSSYKSQNANELVKGLQGAMPFHARTIIESTPRGIGDLFYEEWTNPDSIFHKVFYPWFYMEEYRINEEELAFLTNNLEGGQIPFPQLDNLIADEKDFINLAKKRFGIDIDMHQVAWRRYQKRKFGKLFLQEYPEDDVTCFMVTQSDIFDSDILNQLMTTCDFNPQETMLAGQIQFWKDVEPGHSYIIGADTSEGDIHSDFACGAVLDIDTGEQVARLYGHFKDFILAEKLAILGGIYNDAMIAVERNNHGHSVLNSLVHTHHYKNLYEHDDNKLGWLTSSKTKPMILTGSGGIVEAVHNNYIKIHDKDFLRECYTMEYSTRGKMGARDGCHDDTVMAWAIAWWCRVNSMISKNKDGQPLFVG